MRRYLVPSEILAEDELRADILAALTTEQRQWLAEHPGWSVVTAEKHHRDYAAACRGARPWRGDALLCPDGSNLPGTSIQFRGRVYVRPLDPQH